MGQGIPHKYKLLIYIHLLYIDYSKIHNQSVEFTELELRLS